MKLRWLLLLLVSLNVCYLIWQLLVPAPGTATDAARSGESAIESGVELALWEGRRDEVVQDEAVLNDSAPVFAVSIPCFVIGPFLEAQYRDAVAGGMGLDDSWYRQREVMSDVRYRVYLGPYPNGGAAQRAHDALLADFESRGEPLDSFLVTTGERRDTISLGLFREQENAASVYSLMIELEYDVVLEEEAVMQQEYWLAARVGEDHPLYRQLPAVFGPTMPENLCETIAP